MKFNISILCGAALGAVSLISGSALAAEKSDIRKAVECMPGKDIVKLLTKFDKMDLDKRDTVDAFIAAMFNVEDGHALPDRMFMRSGGVDTDLTIAADGKVPDFDKIADMPKEGEICVEDQARAGLSREDDGMSFSVDFDVKFKDESGIYSLEKLQDGAKDGKSFYKKLVPAPIRLLIPKMTHMSVTFDNPAAEGQRIEAFSGDTPVSGLIIEPFGETSVIEVAHIEGLGADRLVISGGAFDMEPSPSIEKMKKLGFSENDAEEEEEPKID